tara:strand:+ start:1309 stop:2523 length:1215 start_codon:yes stop_codon:yes gene_type:complete
MNAQKKLDLVIWGATGFTGKLVCEYITNSYNSKDLNWTIAGRNEEKLLKLKNRLNIKNSILIGNSNDKYSLEKICGKTKVICSTVGPYALYGTNLIHACIKMKTNYCDISGETQWIRKIIDTFHEKAKKQKIKIVNSCGFDSIPSDMGVYFCQSNYYKENGEYANEINMRVAGTRGGFSGGTYNSLTNVIHEASLNKSVRKILNNPYGLNPINEQSGPDKKDLKSVEYDNEAKSWIAPFVMAGINTKIVRRSNALLNYKYGNSFLYSEAVLVGNGILGKIIGYLSLIPILMVIQKKGSVIKKIVDLFVPKAGEGPSKKQRENGFFSLKFFFGNNRQRYLAKVTGDMDPGYGSTSKMLAECAICLALEDTLNENYGVITPSVAFEENILERLQNNAGLEFSMKKI